MRWHPVNRAVHAKLLAKQRPPVGLALLRGGEAVDSNFGAQRLGICLLRRLQRYAGGVGDPVESAIVGDDRCGIHKLGVPQYIPHILPCFE